jgi:signal transduction histidine kinase
MRKLTFILLLVTLCITGHGQKKAIDSLKNALTTVKDDTSRVMLMNALSRAYLYSRPDSSLLLAQQAAQLAKTIKFLKGEAIGLDHEGLAFNTMGNYPSALTCLISSLKIAEKISDRREIARNTSNIAAIYGLSGDYRQSIIYIKKSWTAIEALHDEKMMANYSLNLGDSYEKLNTLDSAMLYTLRSYQYAVKINDPDMIGTVFNNLGNIYSKMKKTDSALYFYRKAKPLWIKAEDDDGMCETTLGMAKVFRQLGQLDSGLYYARQSIAAGWHGRFTARVLNASQFLTAYFKQQGKLDSAFRYLEVSVTAKDSLFSQEKSKEFQNLTFTERQRQLDIQEKEMAYRASIRFYLLVAVTVFLLIMALVFWRNNRRNEKAKHLLQTQKEQIQTTLGELKTTQNQLVQSAKMASLGELTAGIAHEIQNPLNFVNNFSEVSAELIDEMDEEMQKGDVTEAKAISADIKQNLEKIRHHGKRADFIVKGMLEHSRTSTGERQVTNINVLADEFLKLSYHGLRAKDKSFNAELVTHFDPNLPKVTVVQQDIGRVLINLFSNAFYAVNQKAKTAGADYKPTVEVSTAKENGLILITVKDNGTGIPANIREKIMQPFFTTKPAGEGTGLGLSLSYDIIVKGHGGSLIIDSKEGEATEFTIALPIQ